jgi:hypothetical protein
MLYGTKQNYFKNIFVDILKAIDEKSRIRIRIHNQWYGSAGLDPHQNVAVRIRNIVQTNADPDPQHWYIKQKYKRYTELGCFFSGFK